MKALMSPQEVADLLGVHKNTIYKLIQSGKLPAVRLSERLLRITDTDLKAYLDQK